MYLARVEAVELPVALGRWDHYLPSTISDHGEECCRAARDWFLAMDGSNRHAEFPLAPPEWILRAYPWGTSSWPIHWCELVVADTLDCGVLACTTLEVWRARGARVCFVQMVQEFSEEDIAHWSRQWVEAALNPHWTFGAFSYHEACALVVGDRDIAVWDPSFNTWVHPDIRSGYASTRAIRVFSPDPGEQAPLFWEGVRLEPNVWQVL
jgi:hypothetical protein